MDIYITEKESGIRYGFAMLPEQINYQRAANFRNYDIIHTGEVKTPNGTKLLQFSWSGIFPGENRKEFSFIKTHYWRSPTEMQNLFERWTENGTVLNLMVTETWINHEVVLSEFSASPTGGSGDVNYEVTFIQNREIRIYTTEELNIRTAQDKDIISNRPESAEKSTKIYTVKSGDNLWNIAKKYLGKGSRYMEIYELNKTVIETTAKKYGRQSSAHGHWIYPGETLILPD